MIPKDSTGSQPHQLPMHAHNLQRGFVGDGRTAMMGNRILGTLTLLRQFPSAPRSAALIAAICGILGVAVPTPILAWNKEVFLAPKQSTQDLRMKNRHIPRGRNRLVLLKPDVTLVNLWTHEVLPLARNALLVPKIFEEFFRCHHDGKQHPVDLRLLHLLLSVGQRFRANRIEIISAYRSPSYNEFLRTQGRQVSRESQHMQGRAIDFRVPGIPIARLARFVKMRGLGGVGVYPQSGFIHVDTGPVRVWQGK